MRILFVRDSNKIEVTYWKLVIELLDEKCEIWWMSRPLLRNKLIIDEKELKRIHLVEISSKTKLDFMIKAIPHIRHLSNYVDIIIGTGYSGAYPCILAFPHCPTILHFHDPWYVEKTLNPSLMKKLLIRIGRIMESFLLTRASHILLTSISHKKFLLKRHGFLSEKKITIIRNTVNPERVPIIKDSSLKVKLGLHEKFILVYSGQIVKSYGFDELIMAFAKISEKLPHIHLLLIGIYPDLSYKHHIRRLITSNQLDLNITLLPTISSEKVPKYLTLGDLAIIPWQYNPVINLASPNKLFEYMACGLPIVASQLDGLSEIIEERKNGFLFKPNDLNSMIKTLEKAINFPNLSDIGLWNRKCIEYQYNLKKFIQLLLKLCKNLVNSKKEKKRRD